SVSKTRTSFSLGLGRTAGRWFIDPPIGAAGGGTDHGYRISDTDQSASVFRLSCSTVIVTRLAGVTEVLHPGDVVIARECPQNGRVEMSATPGCGSASKNTGGPVPARLWVLT